MVHDDVAFDDLGLEPFPVISSEEVPFVFIDKGGEEKTFDEFVKLVDESVLKCNYNKVTKKLDVVLLKDTNVNIRQSEQSPITMKVGQTCHLDHEDIIAFAPLSY